MRLFATVFFLFVAVVLLFSDKGQIEGDGIKRWEALDSLMSKGKFTTDKYSIVQPLFAVPLYVIGDFSARLMGHEGAERTHTIQHVVRRFNKGIAMVLAIWLFCFLRSHAEFSLQASAGAVLFLLFGTMLIPHAKDFYSECLWTLLCVLTLHAIVKTDCDRQFRVQLLLPVLIVPLNPVLLPVFALLLFLLAFDSLLRSASISLRGIFASGKKPSVLLPAISLVAGLGLCLLENWIRRGGMLDFGYPGEGFSTPFFYGLAGQLVSPARGIVWYIPAFFCGAILLMHRKSLQPLTARMVLYSFVFCLLLMGVYAKWHAWHGAWYWGPRFLLPLSFFSALYFVLLAKLWWHESMWKRCALVMVGVASYMIYKAGVAIGQGPLLECLREHVLTDYCYWQWQYLPFASWVDRSVLLQMSGHRSMIVEIGALLLVIVCALFCRGRSHKS